MYIFVHMHIARTMPLDFEHKTFNIITDGWTVDTGRVASVSREMDLGPQPEPRHWLRKQVHVTPDPQLIHDIEKR